MNVAIRADASEEMGTGHLKRCLSLADAFAKLGAEVCFVIRQHDGVAERIMAATEYRVLWLPAVQSELAPKIDYVPHAGWSQAGWRRDAEETGAVLDDRVPIWLIVDHYAFDARWHREIKAKLGCSILAIDDLGDRSLAADLLLDANAAVSHADKYVGKLSSDTRMLAGPRFAPLSTAYRDARRYVFSSDVRSIGIFMGGTDAGGASTKVLRALREEAGFRGKVELVTTSSNARRAELAESCARDGNAVLSVDLPELSAFYARHDLQIGAGGTSSYERCCIGVPTVAVVLAANQLAVVPILIKLGVVAGAGIAVTGADDLLPGLPALGDVVRGLLADPQQRRTLSRNASHYVDGRGAERVALVMLADRLTIRRARFDDAAMIHTWRNDPTTRAMSINTSEIAYDDHVRWLAGILEAEKHLLFIAVVGSLPVGVVRFDLLDDGTWEISLYMDPELHGLGLGRQMLLAGEAAVAGLISEVVNFSARIVPGNEVSTRMFVRAGYEGSAERLFKARLQPEDE